MPHLQAPRFNTTSRAMQRRAQLSDAAFWQSARLPQSSFVGRLPAAPTPLRPQQSRSNNLRVHALDAHNVGDMAKAVVAAGMGAGALMMLSAAKERLQGLNFYAACDKLDAAFMPVTVASSRVLRSYTALPAPVRAAVAGSSLGAALVANHALVQSQVPFMVMPVAVWAGMTLIFCGPGRPLETPPEFIGITLIGGFFASAVAGAYEALLAAGVPAHIALPIAVALPATAFDKIAQLGLLR